MADTNFQRPTLQQLIDRIKADFNYRLDGADANLRRSLLIVFSRVLGNLAHNQYGYLDFIARQIMPDTATDENLRRWAAIFKVEANDATKANGNATFIGENGTVIPADTLWQRRDGFEYKTTEEAVIASGSAVVPIEAVSAGILGNTENGTTITIVSPISGLDSAAATGEITGGTDDESNESLLARLLAHIQEPPHGGSESDYNQWALSFPGVTRAWVYPNENGDGTVVVRVMMDDSYANGIPLAGDITTIQEYIDDLRPVTANVNVAAPIADSLNFSIQLKKADGTTETSSTVREAVIAELKDLIRRTAEPGGKVLKSKIEEAIAIAAGEYDHVVSVPSADVTHTTGHIAVFGTVTWL